VFPAPVYLTREGSSARISVRGSVVRVPFEDAERTLVELGDAIAERLARVEDERARTIAAAWSGREQSGTASAAATATGLSEAEVIQLFGKVAPELAKAELRSLRAPNEFLAVARMSAGAAPLEGIEAILQEIAKQPQVWTGPLDELARRFAEDLWRLRDTAPWEQGYEVARLLRAQLNIGDEQRMDPEQVLAGWKITVKDIEVESRLIDALCVWGAKRGPAILVNRKGLHGRMNGRRATLAHEIGHLLMDRNAGLPVGEVLGGRVPQEIEQRAKSFAAELLIPRAEAYRRVIDAGSLVEELASLSEQYGVSLEVIAWQARNGATIPLTAHIRATLSTYVSDPHNF
jgi:Zn-dependent peptidase ImmA (M78 family)